MEEKHEIIKQLLDLGLNYGKKNKSAQTGYVHYCYGANDNEPHLPIPIIENFLYVLTLLRSRIIENVNEAKTLLEGLLHFQNKAEGEMGFGNFPIYIHDFPRCKDRFTGVQVAITIYWIIKLFHHVIGQELNARLEHALLLLLKHLLKTHSEKAAPYPIAMKIAAVAKMGGEYIHHRDIEEIGSELLNHLQTHPEYNYWYCPASLGNMLTALSMVYPQWRESPWQDLWRYLGNTWHRHTCTYVGPAFKEYQQKYEPQVTLYDLFLGHYSGVLSDRSLESSSLHLEAALIPPCEDVLEEPIYPLSLDGVLGSHKWQIYHDRHFAYSLIDTANTLNGLVDKGFYPLRMIWGDCHRIHTFVGYGGVNTQIVSSSSSTNIHFEVILDGDIDVEDRDRIREISFAIDAFPQLTFLVDGQKSSTFRLGEDVMMKGDHGVIKLSFHLESGQGSFMGHRMLGNRPSQLAIKGNHRYDAYDWEVFVRTVARTGPCKLHVDIQKDEV